MHVPYIEAKKIQMEQENRAGRPEGEEIDIVQAPKKKFTKEELYARPWKYWRGDKCPLMFDTLLLEAYEREFCMVSTAGSNMRTEVLLRVNEYEEAQIIDPKIMRGIIARWIDTKIHELTKRAPPNSVVDDMASLAMRRFRVVTEMPLAIRFSDDPGLCFRRIRFKLEEGPTPAWDEYTQRLSDPGFYKAFIWSVFELKNKGRQFMWLRGGGQDGKSVTNSVISELLGNASKPMSDSLAIKPNQFAYTEFLSARLIVYPDAKIVDFPKSEFLRVVTSPFDTARCEIKNGATLSAIIGAKLIIASNFEPRVTGDRADQSRLVWIQVAPSKNTNDPNWSVRLRAELPAFLWACREAYNKLCADCGDIATMAETKALALEASEADELVYRDLMESCFVLDSKASVTGDEFRKVLKFYLNGSAKTQADFVLWLVRTHKVEKVRKHQGYVYAGIKLKKDAGVPSDVPNIILEGMIATSNKKQVD